MTTPETLADWAVYYAIRMGWAVLPLHSMRGDCCSCGSYACPSPAKHPRTRRGVSDASRDEEQIRGWWQRWPDANIGIATGHASGIMVIDIDPRHYGDEHYADLLGEAGLDSLPDSLQCLTGGGGWHDYLAIPQDADIRNAASVRGHEGVDIRGTGGYVVAPPSVHATGRGYCWEMASDPTDGAEIAPCPPRLLELLSGRQPRIRSVRDGDRPRQSRPVGKIREGGRNNDLARYLGGLRSMGADLDELVERGMRYSEAQHEPPLPAREIMAVARSIARYPVRQEMPPAPPPWIDEEDIPPHTDADAPPEMLADSDDPAPQVPADIPEIVLGRPRPEIDPEARAAVLGWLHRRLEGQDLAQYPRQLWLRGGQLVTIAEGDRGELVISPAVTDQVYDLLAHAARWVRLRRTKDGDLEAVPADPPRELAGSLLATPPRHIPRLDGLAPMPVFGGDGTYLVQLGYHRRDAVWRYGMTGPEAYTPPTQDAALDARELILDLIQDFEFRSPADKAALLAYWIVPHMRRMIDGPVPMTVFTAAKNGVGKSLLAEIGQTIFLGHPAGTQALSRRDEELRKTLTAAAVDGAQYLYFDNVDPKSGFASPTLAAALTATYWQDRVLGRSERISIPVSWIPVATTAGGEFSSEMARRAVVCEIVTDYERPWQRRDFAIRDLMGHVRRERKRLVQAIHTMIGAWIADGAPQADITLGSYESWARQMGGLLEWLGVGSLLDNAERVYEAADEEADTWRAIMHAWWDEFEDRAVTVAELTDALDARGILEYLDLGRRPQRNLRKMLIRSTGSVIAGYRIVEAPRKAAKGAPRQWGICAISSQSRTASDESAF